jgi:hypothetical protein
LEWPGNVESIANQGLASTTSIFHSGQ